MLFVADRQNFGPAIWSLCLCVLAASGYVADRSVRRLLPAFRSHQITYKGLACRQADG